MRKGHVGPSLVFIIFGNILSLYTVSYISFITQEQIQRWRGANYRNRTI